MAVPSKYIQSVVKAAKGRPKSTDWYRDKIREFGTPKTLDLIRDGKQAARPFFGRLNMFIYDPKLKKKLPYYDRYPLVFPFERAEGGFYGINLHYLPPRERAVLMDQLNRYANNEKYDKTTSLQLSYNILKRFGRAVPCVKRYLGDRVTSETVRIDADEWEIAIFLPVERFQKASKATVWRDSRRFF